MTATDGEHATQFPDAPATGDEHGAQDQRTKQGITGGCQKAVRCLLAAYIALNIALVVSIVTDTTSEPDYSVALAGLPGVDAAAPGVFATGASQLLAVPALFNLTVRIRNPSGEPGACVTGGAMAVVSYGGAIVGACTVPPFCAEGREEREVVVPVWGMGGVDVTPTPSSTAQGREVEVVVRMPISSGDGRAFEWLLACSVNVGGGMSLCSRR